MLDPKLLRTELEQTARQLACRGYTLDVARIGALEASRKELQVRTQDLQNTRNSRSKAIGKAKAAGQDIQPLLDEVAHLGDELKSAQEELNTVQEQLRQIQLDIPNIAHESTPVGKDEDDNVEVRRWGEPQEMICKDRGLSALDHKLSGVYAAASKKATNEHPPVLKAEQRGWVKGRNDCWKSDDKRRCVEDEYQRRIAELQARYRLVPETGPITYVCEGKSSNEIVATFFQTDPPTLIAERGDSVSLMYLQPSGSGAKFQGRNETFWEHHGEAVITWGYGAPEMLCKKTP